MLDLIQRYQPIIREIKKHPPPEKLVLEVGGGGDGLGHFLKTYHVFDADISFHGHSPSNTRSFAISNQKLPFTDGRFHTTVCIDTLEHLPDELSRNKLIREMCRVTTHWLYLAVPLGEKSLSSHRRLKSFFARFFPGREHHFLKEHLIFPPPEEKKIINQLKKISPRAEIKITGNANTGLWLAFQVVYAFLPNLYRLLKYRRLWLNILTPFWRLTSFPPYIRRIFVCRLKPEDEIY